MADVSGIGGTLAGNALSLSAMKATLQNVLTQENYDHQKNRDKAYASFKNEQCQKCHRNLLYIPEKRGAMLAHRSVVYPMPGYEKQCVDCHKDLVHNPKEFYAYKQYKGNYRGLGL